MSIVESATSLGTYYAVNTAAKACIQFKGDLTTKQMNFMIERIHNEGMAMKTGLCSDHKYLKKINYKREFGTLDSTIWIA